jgi:hypothetical protein
MKCHLCHFPATLQYTFFVAGERCEIHLCERCAQRNDEIRRTRAEVERVTARLRARIPIAKSAAPPAKLDYRDEAAPLGEEIRWFAVGRRSLCCAACESRIDDIPHRFDLRLQTCPVCGVSCLLFAWVDAFVQIIPSYTPEHVREFIALLQSSPSEQAAVEMMSHLQDLFDALKRV